MCDFFDFFTVIFLALPTQTESIKKTEALLTPATEKQMIFGEGCSDPPLRVIRTAAEPRARALGAPPPPCRRTTSWEPMIAKLAGVVPKVTLSNPSGSVSPVPGKTESFAPMLLGKL